MAKDEELYQQIKEEEKEVIVMCESLDRMREEARAEGKIQGEEKAELRILTNLLKKGISDSYILEIYRFIFIHSMWGLFDENLHFLCGISQKHLKKIKKVFI